MDGEMDKKKKKKMKKKEKLEGMKKEMDIVSEIYLVKVKTTECYGEMWHWVMTKDQRIISG